MEISSGKPSKLRPGFWDLAQLPWACSPADVRCRELRSWRGAAQTSQPQIL